jgi:hypothetical protein
MQYAPGKGMAGCVLVKTMKSGAESGGAAQVLLRAWFVRLSLLKSLHGVASLLELPWKRSMRLY